MAMDLNAKAAYIRGMMKGMEFDPTTQEGKIIVAMMTCWKRWPML